jgi:hypothetical protein
MKGDRRWAIAGALLALGTAGALAAAGVLGRERAELGLLWLAFAGVALLALESGLRGPRREALGVAAVLLAGVVARLVAPSGPANWYVDVLPPEGVEGYTPRRAVGFGHTYRALATVVGVDDTVIYGVSVVSSSLGLALLWRALFGGAGASRWPSGTRWIWAALLCCYPPIVLVGASDAVQNVALLAIGVAAWSFRRTLEGSPRAAAMAALPLVFAAGLTGMTRPEYAHAPLLLPLVVLPAPGGWRRWLAGSVGLALGVGAGLALWAGQHLGVTWDGASGARLAEWLGYVARPLLGLAPGCEAMTVAGPVEWSPAQAWLARLVLLAAALAAGLGLFVALRRRGGAWAWLGPAGAAAAYLLSALPPAFTGALGLTLGCRLVTSRYTLVTAAALFLVYCAGAALLAGLARRGGRVAGAVGLTAGAVIVGTIWIPTTLAPATEPYPHRVEAAALGEALAGVPAGATIYTHWADHFPSRRDPDAGLAPGHPLLAFERPDLLWVVLAPDDPLPGLGCDGCWYYRGAMCDLDVEHVRRENGDEDAAFVGRLGAACRAGAERVGDWLFEREEAVAPWHWATVENRISIGLGRW